MKRNEGISIERAKSEEEKFNWEDSAKIYEELLVESEYCENLHQASKLSKRLGYVSAQAADTMRTTGRYLEFKRRAIIFYKKASEFYKKLENKADELECIAEALYEEGCCSSSILEGEEEFKSSKEFFIQASELFSNKGDEEGFTRNIIRSAMCMHNLMKYAKNPKELEKMIHEGMLYADKAWKSSKKMNNFSYLVESLYVWMSLGLYNCYIEDIPTYDNLNQGKTLAFDWKKWSERTKLTFELTKEHSNFKIQGSINFFYGVIHFYYGFFLAENIIEQNNNIEKGLIFFEKSLDFIRKTRENGHITITLFYLNWFTFFGGKINYVQKRIIQDIKEIKEAGLAYSNLFSFWNFYSNFLPALYYSNIAQRSFFAPKQRESYAKEALEYAKASNSNVAYKPFSAWAYQILTWSYSQLVYLAKNEEERNKYAKKMLENAENAYKIGSEYKNGLSKTSGYSARYRSFKSLADIAKNKDKKIEMLRIAVDAADNYLDHPIESRTGFIAARIRLGLLYEELGIVSMDNTYLEKAKNIFETVIEESLNRGYLSYAAACHEYIAHIEDRLGNFNLSAKHYDKAQKGYQESLKNIEYKLLKNRINEKKNYSLAWKLIENAKSYHKSEDHSKAKKNYEDAYEILNSLSKYNYEAYYYFAWTLLEEAELLSKNENHDNAIEHYEQAKIKFYESITVLESVLNKSREKLENKRIGKLIKVARVRMNYCSARVNIEEARLLEKQGDNLAAAEKFATAASIFKELCELFRIETERVELEAIYLLCRAWETMSIAEKYEDSSRFLQASGLFDKASGLFIEKKLKLLASGNSSFCRALELGCKFDKSLDMEYKAEIYPKVKMLIRDAASSYRKGGLVSGADWALATSTYFDATWHIIKADA
ncbi:MAG: tetratricopeptide repeat protein, partial [Promethearchaeota archaeon]